MGMGMTFPFFLSLDTGVYWYTRICLVECSLPMGDGSRRSLKSLPTQPFYDFVIPLREFNVWKWKVGKFGVGVLAQIF